MKAEPAADPPDGNAPGSLSPDMDIRDRGIGDVVMAAWLTATARAVGRTLTVNVRGHDELARALGMTDDELSDREGPSWTGTPGLGLKREYALVAGGDRRGRLAIWGEGLGVDASEPVRPAVALTQEAVDWAAAEWAASMVEGRPGRVAILPQAAWPVRQWPLAYFIDLAAALEDRGYSVVILGSRKDAVSGHGRRWYAGFDLTRTAAMLHLADLVIANDSGPAHLGGAVGTETVALCGPTRGATVFAHDPLIHPIAIDAAAVPCVGCHFDRQAGYRQACRSGGCRALFMLSPEAVLADMATRELGLPIPPEFRMPELRMPELRLPELRRAAERR